MSELAGVLLRVLCYFFFFKQKTAYEMRISDWSSDVCSSDLQTAAHKAPGYAIANISLKPIHGIGGDITADQMDVVADLAERYSFGEVRVTHAQKIGRASCRERVCQYV